MLTSADLLVFRYGGHIGKRQDPGDEISKGQVGESPLQALLQARGNCPGMLCAAVQSSPLSQQLQKLSLSKRGQVRNLSGVNVFYLNETNMKYFSNQ